MNDITDNQIEESTEIDDGRRWYFVHTYSGQEERVKRNLEQRIETMDVENKIFQVLIPTEEVVDGLRPFVVLARATLLLSRSGCLAW